MSYSVKYPFTLTRSSNQNGAIESEVTFEGFATFFEDKETQFSTWEIEAWVTFFAQYKNGKQLLMVTGIKSKDWTVEDMGAFEADCVDRACFQYQLKNTKQAA